MPNNSITGKESKSEVKILVTGAAGFIGYHLSKQLLEEGHEVVGVDNLNHYYDVRLKLARLNELGIDAYEIAMGKQEIKSRLSDFRFFKMDIEERAKLSELFASEKFEVVFHMAAQAGVRYSIEQPDTYIQSNIVAFAKLLEACRHHPVKLLIYASSSSVYGNSKNIPFKTSENVDRPISLYAATKKSNELMAHTYSHLFGIPTIGLRFFTVYGEWGRPDMAAMLFAKAILNGEPIKVFNKGNMSRDFTYVGDIVGGMTQVLHKRMENTQALAPLYKIYNIGNSKPVNLLEFIEEMEQAIGKKAEKEWHPMQPGDVENTYADVTELKNDFGYEPQTSIRKGLKSFAEWYIAYSKDDLFT